MMSDIDFRRAFIKANELLVRAGVSYFPFDIRNFVKQEPNCVCRTFEKARKYGIDIDAYGSESAVLIQKGNKNIIFVDEQKPTCHTNFSVAHELGHLACGHDLYCQDLSREKYNKCEIEANYFAAQVLMPEQIIRELQRRGLQLTSSMLQKNFGVSETAALKRIETMRHTAGLVRDRSEREFDDIILEQCRIMFDTFCLGQDLYDFEQEYEQQQIRNGWMYK